MLNYANVQKITPVRLVTSIVVIILTFVGCLMVAPRSEAAQGYALNFKLDLGPYPDNYQTEDLVIGPDDNIYSIGGVSPARDVIKWNKGGVRLSSWPVSSQASSIDVGPDGYIYVAGESSVTVYDPDGVQVDSWGAAGSGPGQFSYIRSISVDSSNNVYVGDVFNRVQKLSREGTFMTQWNGVTPTRMDVDSHGNIHVLQSGGGIRVYSPTGSFLRQIGDAEPGQYQMDIAIDAQDYIYKFDTLSTSEQIGAMTKYSPDGTWVTQRLIPYPLYGKVDSDGFVYVAPTWSDLVQVYGTGWRIVGGSSQQMGEQAVGSRGPVQYVEVRNNGTAMYLTSVSLSNTDDFQIVDEKDCEGEVLEAMTSCSIGIRLQPTVLGPVSAQLKVETSFGERNVELVGAGITSLGVTGPTGGTGEAGPTGPRGIPGRPGDNQAGGFDGKNLFIRLKCPARFKPGCFAKVNAVVRKKKRLRLARIITRTVRVNQRAGQWTRVKLRVRPRYRGLVAQFSKRPNVKTLVVRQAIRSKRYDFNKRIVFHKYRVRSTR
jgi:hypothetical protein